MLGSRRVRLVVSLLLWGAIMYYFVAVLRRVDWHAVAAQHVDRLLAVAVLIVGTASRFLLPVTWTIALSSLEGKRMRTRLLLWPYAESWMARDLPGQVRVTGN